MCVLYCLFPLVWIKDMQIAQNWPLHKKIIFCLRQLAVSEVFVNISAESGHETQTRQSSECTTAFLWQFKFWVKSLTVLSLFEWIQQKQGILSGSFSHLLYPPSCDLEIYLSVSSQKVSKWHLERKRDATGQVCRLHRSVHLFTCAHPTHAGNPFVGEIQEK